MARKRSQLWGHTCKPQVPVGVQEPKEANDPLDDRGCRSLQGCIHGLENTSRGQTFENWINIVLEISTTQISSGTKQRKDDYEKKDSSNVGKSKQVATVKEVTEPKQVV